MRDLEDYTSKQVFKWQVKRLLTAEGGSYTKKPSFPLVLRLITMLVIPIHPKGDGGGLGITIIKNFQISALLIRELILGIKVMIIRHNMTMTIMINMHF